MLSTFSGPGQWYKGNLHAHTNLSDGILSPEALVSRYKALGYSFLTLADHRVYHHHDGLCEETFLTLPGLEMDASFGDRPGKHYHHIVGVGLAQLPDGFRRESEGENAGDIAQRHITWLLGEGMLPIYCHPRWSMATVDEVAHLTGFCMIEVYNHLCQRQDGSGEAEAWWDHLLWEGRRVLCTASDDTHQKINDIGGGFIMVKAKSLTREAILASLRAGRFYASQGPVIEDIRRMDGTLEVFTSPAASIAFVCYPYRGYQENADKTLITQAAWHPPEGARYVRLVVTDCEGRKAWSQPIDWEGM